MPEPQDNSVGSWWLSGSKDDYHTTDLKNSKKDAGVEQTNNQLLLHRMFEAFVDDAIKMGYNDDSRNGGMKDDHPALTEYLEGVNVENMKTMSYKSLNEQSNRLANILTRKLGTDQKQIHQ